MRSVVCVCSGACKCLHSMNYVIFSFKRAIPLHQHKSVRIPSKFINFANKNIFHSISFQFKIHCACLGGYSVAFASVRMCLFCCVCACERVFIFSFDSQMQMQKLIRLNFGQIQSAYTKAHQFEYSDN